MLLVLPVTQILCNVLVVLPVTQILCNVLVVLPVTQILCNVLVVLPVTQILLSCNRDQQRILIMNHIQGVTSQKTAAIISNLATNIKLQNTPTE